MLIELVKTCVALIARHTDKMLAEHSSQNKRPPIARSKKFNYFYEKVFIIAYPLNLIINTCLFKNNQFKSIGPMMMQESLMKMHTRFEQLVIGFI